MLWYSGACPGTCRGKHRPDTDTGIYWYILLNRHSLGRHWLRSLRALYLFISFHAGCGYAALLRLWSTLSIQSYSIFLYCIVPKQCKVGSRCLWWYYWRRGENTKIIQDSSTPAAHTAATLFWASFTSSPLPTAAWPRSNHVGSLFSCQCFFHRFSIKLVCCVFQYVQYSHYYTLEVICKRRARRKSQKSKLSLDWRLGCLSQSTSNHQNQYLYPLCINVQLA